MKHLALVAALAAALGCMRRPAIGFAVAEYREPGQLAAAAPPSPPAIRVLVLGDFGDPTPQQRRVTEALLRWHAAHPFDLALQPGDNVYQCGPDPRAAAACRFSRDGATLVPGFEPPPDPLFERNEAPLRALRRRDGTQVPTWLALGNHDVGALPRACRVGGVEREEAMRRRACLEVAHRTPVWQLPARHYVRDEGPIRFIVVDSNVAVADYAGFSLAAEEAFVRQASLECRTRRCFLVAHHPPAMGVDRSPRSDQASVFRMRRLVDAAGGGLAAVITGHVHALEHLTYRNVDVLIAGAGARPGRDRFSRGWPGDARLHFASDAGGFGVLEVGDAGWSFRLVDDQGRSLHCCEALGRGRCLPVACTESP